MHLAYIHRLRGAAIVGIVGVHCMDFLDWGNNLQGHRLAMEVLQGSTILFFMISGLLFQHLSSRIGYADYLRRKFQNVLLPYLFVSVPGIALQLSRNQVIDENPELAGSPQWLRVAFLYLYGGSQINQALWFVPVMCIFYALAPLFWRMLKHPRSFAVLWVLLPLAFVEHRPLVTKYNNLALALYFLPAYLLGMWIGLNRDRVIEFTNRHALLLIVAIVAIIVGHHQMTPYHGTYVDRPFSGEQGLIDWIYVQKILVFIVLMAALKRLDHRQMPLMDYLATCSFGIYFVHVYVLYSFPTHWHEVAGGVFSLLWVSALTAALSLLLVHLVRLVMGSRSRVLIGA